MIPFPAWNQENWSTRLCMPGSEQPSCLCSGKVNVRLKALAVYAFCCWSTAHLVSMANSQARDSSTSCWTTYPSFSKSWTRCTVSSVAKAASFYCRTCHQSSCRLRVKKRLTRCQSVFRVSVCFLPFPAVCPTNLGLHCQI
jgi:hypothetical protein